jgi:ribose transport system ATP-binding protein
MTPRRRRRSSSSSSSAAAAKQLPGRDPEGLPASDATQPQPLVVIEGLTKSYDGSRALRGVSFAIKAGEIHGLLGANGAGKSTLIKVLAGAIAPDAGRILVDGVPTRITTPAAALGLGFEFLHQELSLVPRSTAFDNLVLGLLHRDRTGRTNHRELRQRAETVGQSIGFDFSLNVRVDQLSVAQQWLVAIGRSLMRNARMIAFDEPTASLSARESQAVFAVLNRLREDGIAIIYVTHRLDEVEQICDRVTVFRDGLVEAELAGDSINRAEMIRAIVGGEQAALTVGRHQSAPGPVVLSGRGLTREPRVRNVSFELRSGEILGVAGLVGAGRTELARLLYGADRLESGDLEISGSPIRLRKPSDAKAAGIGLVPEERRRDGLVLALDAAFNINLAFPGPQRMSRFVPLISSRRTDRRARDMAEELTLSPPNVHRRAAYFSGGNQQKLVLARWLVGSVKVMILDEPTRGVDVGARAQINALVRKMADDGLGVILIASDFEELLGCDRVLVMANGEMVSELQDDGITVANMLKAAYGGEQPDQAQQSVAS